MDIERTSRRLPFSCEQIFDLAADVERYPEFLPWWVSARILRREANRLVVEQELGIGPMTMYFKSEATLDRPTGIEVTSAESTFRQFHLRFTITPSPSPSQAAPPGCTMSIRAQLEPRAFLLRRVVDRVLGSSVDGIVAAFEDRARAVYTAASVL